MNNEVKLFDITDLAIQELKDRYSGLTISGIDDKEGYKAVKAARIVMKGYRVDIDKRRKELTEDALKHQRFINSEAKKITEKLSEIEDYLAGQEKKIDDELSAMKAEQFRQLELKKQARIDALVECGLRFNGNMFTGTTRTIILPLVTMTAMTDEEFAEYIAEQLEFKAEDDRKRAEFQAEQARKAEEAKAEQDRIAAELAAERAKLAAERMEQEAKANALAEKERAIKAESERIDNEKKAIAASEMLNKFAPIKPDTKEAALRQAENLVDRIFIPPNAADLILDRKTLERVEPELVEDMRKEAVNLKPYEVIICGTYKAAAIKYATNEDEALKAVLEAHERHELVMDYVLISTSVTER